MALGHPPGHECRACQDELDEAVSDAPDVVCPACGQLRDHHWTLGMSRDELEEWDKNDDVCTPSRGEVDDLLRGGEAMDREPTDVA